MTEPATCVHCGGGKYQLYPGGQTWMGVKGYSDPQYWHLSHWCAKPEADPFLTCTITLRGRTNEELLARWTKMNARGESDG